MQVNRSSIRRGLVLLLPAALFLFHPAMGFSDPLPDCIGYLLLTLAASRLGELNERIEEALGRFRIMTWIGLGALLLQYYCHTVLPGAEEELNALQLPTLLLIGAFGLAVLQCWFLVPAWRAFFLGISTLAERQGCDRLKRTRRGRSRCERMASYSAVFFTLQAILQMLPEFAALTSFEYRQGSMAVDWYRFAELLRLLASLPLWVMGLIWLLRFAWILLDGVRSQDWIERLDFVYAEQFLPNAAARDRRTVKLAFSLLGIGAVFSADIKLDDRSLLPAVLCAMLLTVGVLVLGDRVPQRAAFLSSAAALGLSGIAELITRHFYLLEYTPEASVHSPEAYLQYLAVRILDCAEAIFAGVTLCLLLRLLYGFCRSHVAVHFEGEGAEDASRRATARLQRELTRRILLTGVLSVLAAFANAANAVLHLELPWLWWVAFGLSLASILCFLSLLRQIREAME